MGNARCVAVACGLYHVFEVDQSPFSHYNLTISLAKKDLPDWRRTFLADKSTSADHVH